MTENEAIKHLKLCMKSRMFIPNNDVLGVAIKALEEIQQYRALGTVEELKTFKDGFAVDFANMGYEKGLRDGYSKAKAYYKEQMKGGE